MSENALITLDETKTNELFVMNGLDEFINKIKAEVEKAPNDISTKSGRAEIASLAFKVAKSKKEIERLGKKAAEDAKKTIAAINSERDRGVAALQEIQDNIRKPLTEWEEAEEARVNVHEERIKDIITLGNNASNWQNSDFLTLNDYLEKIGNFNFDWQEFKNRAEAEIEKSTLLVKSAIECRTRYDAEQAELVKLRAEQVAREQKERDDKIAAEAAEKARLEAERIANAARLEAEAKAKAEADKIEREKQDAIQRAKKAEADRLAAELAAKELAEKVAADKLAAEKKAEADKQAAIEAERKRQADEAAKIAAETAKREADTKHKAKINNEALLGILSVIFSQPPEDCTEYEKNTGKNLIKAIASGQIAHVKINY